MRTDNAISAPPKAAYVHIPFCLSKCHYCDFNSFPGMQPYFEGYVKAIISEIQREKSACPLESVYFGGGTPTTLSSEQLARVLASVKGSLGLASNAEVTVEANPGTLDKAKLISLRESGFNRLSLGVQSLDDELLQKIGRVHTAADALQSYALARSAGFSNVGIDLMFALPGQSLASWGATLDEATGLFSEHVSLYELTIEEGTRFTRMCAAGALEMPNEDAIIEMYELTVSKLTSAGYEHYEVSNFARPGFRSRHNQVYWRNEPYYGFGAGATSYVAGCRARRIGDPPKYIAAIESGLDAIESCEHLTGRALMGETAILGLRMLDGIDPDRVFPGTGRSISDEFAAEIASLQDKGLLQTSGERLKVTHKGLLLLNDVAREFVA